MGLASNFLARIRAISEPSVWGQGDDKPVTGNARGDLSVAIGLPLLAEVTRLGNSWGILSAAAAAATAVPTVAAGHSLWNGESANGKSYVIESFGCIEIITDATQQNSVALMAMNSNIGSVSAPTDAALTKSSMNGRTYGGKARSVAGGTVVDNGWQPHGPSTPGATAFAGAVWRVTEYDAHGLYVVQPGGQFNWIAIKSAATASQIRYFVRWHEVVLPLIS